MRLVYWFCLHRHDSKAYSIRARTRKDAVRQRRESGVSDYAPPKKIVIEYTDAFDLLLKALGEGSQEW